MLFNSAQFLIFLPIVISIYYLVPRRVKSYWLLAASYFFYMCWNAGYIVLILFSTIVTYITGILIERTQKGKKDSEERAVFDKRMWLTVGIVLNLLVLFLFKYLNFGVEILNSLCGRFSISLHVPAFDLLLPVGISFYTFQALGYVIDVYRGEIHAEKDFFQYALFLSFFPQLVAGPIERSGNLLKQLSALPDKISFAKWKEGTLLILWGYWLKVVLSDRIAIFVDTVYGDIDTYSGCFLVVATMLFAVQIYCDFAGYSIIAIGTARILGIQLMENFNAPYFAMSVSEFWRRWHISLSGWFRDYLYIPLGGNR
ncbi:MAG: MBOAT family protein, partial [Lachnospiraceae bacterium]|nr:MBOAT family protein [Lachnospiraceae bacterium]